jgi:hypothetical protein
MTIPQLFKEFPAFYKTRTFITAFTRARQLSLSQATRAIQIIRSKGKGTVVPAHAMKAYGKVEMYLLSFLVDGGYCSTSRPGRFTSK